MKIKVELIDEVNYPETPKKQEFKDWVQKAMEKILTLKTLIPAKEVSISLVDIDKSAALNQQYRQKPGPTNVLAFGYPIMPGIPLETLGDLVICSGVVAEEANKQDKILKAHFAHLTIHGILHLLGYDHETELQAKEMEQLETQVLLELGFPDPYLLR